MHPEEVCGVCGEAGDAHYACSSLVGWGKEDPVGAQREHQVTELREILADLKRPAVTAHGRRPTYVYSLEVLYR